MCLKETCVDAYESTISTSKEESVQRAVSIILMELENSSHIERPDFNPKKGIIVLLVFLASVCILLYVFSLLGIPSYYVTVLSLIVYVINAKKIITWLILFYQKFAPERIRKSCVFEPSCSNYMLQAIEKYGLCKGVFKGIRRVLRCHQPNGGIDNP